MIETLNDALMARGYTTLTPVQEAVSAPALAAADLLVSAQTGSGKTVAFGLAIAPTLLDGGDRFQSAAAPLALVIAPTRELALQVARELTWLYEKAGAVVISCVGGMDSRAEQRALARGAHVVVATPGRLCDHIKRGNIDLAQLKAVVLDEADEMLDLGFREELEFILDEAPDDRRTLMFSATVPKTIAKLAERYQRDAQRITTTAETRQHADIEYRAFTTHPRDIENAIINVLRFYEAKNAIVFCNTRAAVARLTTRFTNRGFSVVALSGELTQAERSNALQALRDGRARVCVATDVAARGIDLPHLELVIHADLPTNADTLLHRSGRTGRAGRKGVSALIVPPKLNSKANRLLGWAKLKADWSAPPSAAEVNAQDEARLLSDPAWTEAVPEDAETLIAQLTEQFGPDQLAQAFVNLWRARRSAPEELTDASVPDDRPRERFGPSVWFAVSIGRNDGAEPRKILPMVCKHGGLTKNDIGAIRIQNDRSFVEVLATRSDAFISALGPEMALEPGVTVAPAEAPPASSPRGTGPDKKGKPPRAPARKPSKSAAPRDDAPKPPHKRKAEKALADPQVHREARGKPKPVWTSKAKDTAKAERKERDRDQKGDSPKSKPSGKPKRKNAAPARDDASKKRAADTSKRFVPPHKRGQSTGKGPGAKPKRR
ncbi:MAG: DEAD/DEAH box helicase [Roseobacter sp.]|nr:DEAD/DEAH box helicase [Roseobacter sp.]